MSGVRPCVFPGCRDAEGNARLTQATICGGCRSRYRKVLGWLALDYTELLSLPQPAADPFAEHKRRQLHQEFGHPAEWASDTLAAIAAWFNTAEHDLRCAKGEEPAVHPGHRELRRVVLGWNYLSVRFDDFCELEDAGRHADHAVTLHQKIRRSLGHTRIHYHITAPCPRCNMLTLFRTVDRSSADTIHCRNCDHRVSEDHFAFYVRVLLDRLVPAEEVG